MVAADVALPRSQQLAGTTEAGAGYRIAKRAVDLLLASLAIVLLSPLLLLLAVAIAVDSPGPVIFSQQRVRGRRRRDGGESVWQTEPFTLFKFRTMRFRSDHSIHREYMAAYLAGDEKRLRELRPEWKEGDSYRPANDPRVTRLGAILRKFSLDEIPQLWNVIRGEMSLVGPRPPVPYEVEMYSERALRRLACKPGLTGWAQVRGRTSIGFEEVVRLDLDYVDRRSTLFDLKILFLTIPVVLSRRGAD
jgi:lipopolysaccharide/colanic/teichoic acid biosynthesis glycosyltransferase